jgi:hypothetical protein
VVWREGRWIGFNVHVNTRATAHRAIERGCYLVALNVVCLTFLSIPAANATALEEWFPRESPLPEDARVRGVAFGNNRFVAVAYADGHAITSADGVNWELQGTGTAGTTKKLTGIAHGNGVFVAVGTSGHVRTTIDGVTWHAQSADTTAHFNGVSFVNDRFLATGDSGALLSSPDGVTWTPHNTASSNRWHSAAYGNGTFVAIGYRTPQAGRAAAGAVPGEWELSDTGYTMYMSGVTYGAGKFVCVGYAGAAQTSIDGIEWTEPITASSANWLRRIVYEAGQFVAVGENGIAASPDGTAWQTVYRSGFKTIEGIAYGNGTFVVVGQDGLILQSAPVSATTPIQLTRPVKLEQGFQFEFTGEIGRSYVIESSADLTHWSTLNQVDCTSPTMTVVDAAAIAPRFYRVVQP